MTTTDLGNGFFKVDPATATDDQVRAVLAKISPSGAFNDIADTYENHELDELQDQADAVFRAVEAHLSVPTLISRLEDDLALAAPAVVDAAGALENYVIPLLSALAGPAAPFVSFGLKCACAIACAVYKSWAQKRLAAKKSTA